MDSANNEKAASIKRQIDDYDAQLAAISRLKAEAKKEFNTLVPKIGDQMKNMKRKFDEKKEKDFENIRQLLSSDKIFNLNGEETKQKEDSDKEEEKKVKNSDNEDKNDEIPIRKVVRRRDKEEKKQDQNSNNEDKTDEIPIRKVVKKRRNYYSNETKLAICLAIDEYGYKIVQEETGVPLESLKTMKKTYNRSGEWTGMRGRKIRYPDLDVDIKN